MYHEEIGYITGEHLRSHIKEYLQELEARYGDGVKLALPKAIESTKPVGGVFNTSLAQMPAYAIEVGGKTLSAVSNNGLWEYAYDGYITGIVTGNSEDAVNKLVNRHEQAVEMFIKRHAFLHNIGAQVAGNEFTIVELGFRDADFSGGEMVREKAGGREAWIAGFRNTLVWVVSEDGPGQH